MFNFWWSAEWSEQKMLTEMQKYKKGPLSHWKIKCSFLDYIQLLMIGWSIRAKNVDRNAKKWKRPPKSSKNKMFIFGSHSTFDDWPSNPSKKCWPKCKKNKKGPLSHRKIKCLFLDYIQLLMIGRTIWAKNVDQNTKKWKRPPKSSKNKMFVFGLCSTSDDRPSDLSKNVDWNTKKWKRPPKSSKNKMFVFGLRSTSDDRLSNLSKNVDQNTKKWKRPPKSSKNKMFIFGLRSTFDDRPSNSSKKCWPKRKKMKKAP